MAKLTLNTIGSRYGSIDALNDNFDAIEAAIENTFSLDGTSPNALEADLDMNNQDILNAKDVNASNLYINGVLVEPSTGVTTSAVFQTYEFTATAAQTTFSVAPATPQVASITVSVNGLVLPPSEISVSTTNVVIPACTAGDEVLIRRYTTSPSAAPDASNINFIQAGTGAVTRNSQSKMRELVSPLDFGAVGDGTTDDTAAVLAALQSGRIVDGGGLTYAISGTMQPTSFVGLRNTNFIQLSPTTISVATLYIYALSNWFIDTCTFNIGSTQNTGSKDDSGRSALRVGNASGSYCLNFRIRNVTVYGDGNGSRIQVRQSKRFVIDGCLVRDGIAGFTPDPTDDIMNGFDISDCANFTLANSSVYNLQCVLSGTPTVRYTRGFLLTEIRDCTIVGCNATATDQNFDFSGSVITGTTPSYYEGNRRFTISGCTSNNAKTWGFKFANVTHDGLITGCISNNSGSGGFVVSPSSSVLTPLAYITSNLDFVGCKAVNVLNNGGAGVGIAQGFRVMSGSAVIGTAPNTMDTYPRAIRFRSCEVIDTQPVPTTVAGFINDVVQLQPTTTGYNTNIGSSAVGCSVGPGVTVPFDKIGPVVCQVTGSTTQSTGTATWVAVIWDVNTIDNQGLHSTSTNADKIYIKDSGTYQITSQVQFAGSATGVRFIRLVKNGVAMDRTTVSASSSGSGGPQTVQTMTLSSAVAGDSFSVEVFQSSGGNLDARVNESNFIVQKVD